MLKPRPVISGIAHQTEASSGNRQRSAERNLPDEQKRNQPPPLMGTINLAQVSIRSARARQRSAQLRRSQPVAYGKQRSHYPSQQRLWAAHGRQNQRHGNERPHADH